MEWMVSGGLPQLYCEWALNLEWDEEEVRTLMMDQLHGFGGQSLQMLMQQQNEVQASSQVLVVQNAFGKN